MTICWNNPPRALQSLPTPLPSIVWAVKYAHTHTNGLSHNLTEKKMHQRTQHTRSITIDYDVLLQLLLIFLPKSLLFAAENHHDDNSVEAIVDHRVRVPMVFSSMDKKKKFKTQI